MEEDLISAVTGFPELYDVSLFIYRDAQKKREAWRQVANVVGVSVDDCKKKWKNLRDIHRRERKKERSRRGAEASAHRPWRHSQMMSFLNPFMEDRPSGSSAPASGSRSLGDGGEDATTTSQASSEAESELVSLCLGPVPPESQAQSPTPTPTPSLSTPRVRNRGRKRSQDDALSPFERQLMEAMERAVTQTAPPDPDRQFFDGLLPDLKALSAEAKAEVKFKIHQLIFEAACRGNALR